MAGIDGVENAVRNLTDDDQHVLHHSPYPSVWSLIKNRVNEMVNDAVRRASTPLNYSSTIMGNFKERLESLLGDPLSNVAAGHPMGQGNFTINKDIDGAVKGAVDEAMTELNMTEASNSSSDSFKYNFINTLDTEIELGVFNEVFRNASHDQETDFFHKMPIKDETMFVALVCMGIIVPIIFITLFLIFFYKRREENRERRQEMLLKEQPEFSMDEYNTDGKNYDEDVPDLDLKNLRV